MKTDKYSNLEISELLRGIAGAYQIKDANQFKIIAYERAADTIEHLNRELKDIWRDGKLDQVPTLGPSIRSSLDEYFKTGKVRHFETILKGIPPAVFELMKIPSIGPRKAYKLAEALQLKDPKAILKDIQKAARSNKIAGIESFGEKSQEDILEAVTLYQKNKTVEKRMPLPIANSVAEKIIAYLKEDPAVKRIDALGSLRRKVATIGDVDLAVGIDNNDFLPIIDRFTAYPGKVKVDNAGENKASIIVTPNVRVDLRVQTMENYGSMLQYFTGSKSHNIMLREYALRNGWSLSEYGIKEIKSGKLHHFANEETFYGFLGMSYIPPEIREGTNEITLALKHKLPHLVELADIRGDFHMHSSYDLKPSHDSGADSYEDLLNEGQVYGYEYIGLSDHNPKTGDLSKAQITAIMKKRFKHIREIAEKYSPYIRCFIGLETDILPDGSLALPQEAYEYVDYLIVSVHSAFNQNVETMTRRFQKAMAYPKVKVLGHPTGRLLGHREGYETDWSVIFKEAVQRNIALEINSWPQRLDLPDTLVREAKSFGVKFMVDTDSHAKSQLANMEYGVSVARRGWLEKRDIINTGSYQDVKDWLTKGS